MIQSDKDVSRIGERISDYTLNAYYWKVTLCLEWQPQTTGENFFHFSLQGLLFLLNIDTAFCLTTGPVQTLKFGGENKVILAISL